MTSKQQTRRVIACGLILLMLGGCDFASRGTKGYCLSYQPVYTSPRDTEETRLQVDGNNAVWLAQGCGK